MKYSKVELHLHLDGSINLAWAYKVAKKNNLISQDMSFEDYYIQFYNTNYSNLQEVFKKFDLAIEVLLEKEDIIEGTKLVVESLADQGIAYAEIRFAPQQHTLNGLTQAEAVQAVIDGVNKAKEVRDIEIGIINCLMHKGENALVNEKENFETVEVTKQFLGKGVVGIDLAGFENNGEFMLYAPLFKKAKEYNIPCTIHAGEMGMGEHVHEAIVMGADRIGHGVNCVNNPEWLKEVVDTQIPLEVCVTSNVGVERNYSKHPVRQLIKAGAKVTINSDNMMFSRTNLNQEHSMLKMIGVTDEELKQCTLNAIDAAFCSEEIKEKLRKSIED